MKEALSSGYRLLADLLLHPDDRDRAVLDEGARRLDDLPAEVASPIRAFLADPAASSADVYVQTLELSAPVSLYLGAYLFEEPKTCGAAATSERNAYMIELAGIYRHFALDPVPKEMPDFLPVMVDFLRLSLDRAAREGASLRKYLIEKHLLPGLPKLGSAMEKCPTPYARLVEALEALARLDLKSLADVRAWIPPVPAPVAQT